MRRRLVAVCVLVSIGSSAAAERLTRNASNAIRGDGSAIQLLIDRGMERSGTFRELAARLDGSDVTVYVRYSRCGGGVPACLLWASAAGGVRRLLVKVDGVGRPQNDLIALLAHELQHANEVASSPSIRDLASFQEVFAARGWRSGDGFETAEAKAITRRVTAELSR